MSSFQDVFKNVSAPIRIPAPIPVPLHAPALPDIVVPAQDFARHVLEEMQALDATLDQEHEVAVCLASFGQSVVIHVDEIVARGAFFVVFHGRASDDGGPVALVQHLSQANLLLVSAERLDPTAPKRPIGFAVEPESAAEQQ